MQWSDWERVATVGNECEVWGLIEDKKCIIIFDYVTIPSSTVIE